MCDETTMYEQHEFLDSTGAGFPATGDTARYKMRSAVFPSTTQYAAKMLVSCHAMNTNILGAFFLSRKERSTFRQEIKISKIKKKLKF